MRWGSRSATGASPVPRSAGARRRGGPPGSDAQVGPEDLARPRARRHPGPAARRCPGREDARRSPRRPPGWRSRPDRASAPPRTACADPAASRGSSAPPPPRGRVRNPARWHTRGSRSRRSPRRPAVRGRRGGSRGSRWPRSPPPEASPRPRERREHLCEGGRVRPGQSPHLGRRQVLARAGGPRRRAAGRPASRCHSGSPQVASSPPALSAIAGATRSAARASRSPLPSRPDRAAKPRWVISAGQRPVRTWRPAA